MKVRKMAFLAAICGSAQAQQFIDITPAIAPAGLIAPSRPFWAGAPDINGDGCIDFFTGSHSDGSIPPSAVIIQERIAGICANTWTQVSN